MKLCLLPALAGLVLAPAAAAADAPGAPATPAPAPAPPADGRVRLVDYDPDAVVRIAGVLRAATQVLFSDEEDILHVAVGDADAWEVAVEGSVLFLKPRAVRAPTNLIVTTVRPQGRRHYLFELTAAAGGTRARATFALKFRYPGDRPAGAAEVAAASAALERRLLSLKLDRAVVLGPRNLAYDVQGDAALQPSEVSDNGRFTLLRFPANQALPALYQVTDDGDEQLIPFDVRGDFVVVHAVVRRLRLRSGERVLCLYNRAFDPRGVASGTGTAADDVERTPRGGQP